MLLLHRTERVERPVDESHFESHKESETGPFYDAGLKIIQFCFHVMLGISKRRASFSIKSVLSKIALCTMP
jgi:hypothetical protein